MHRSNLMLATGHILHSCRLWVYNCLLLSGLHLTLNSQQWQHCNCSEKAWLSFGVMPYTKTTTTRLHPLLLRPAQHPVYLQSDASRSAIHAAALELLQCCQTTAVAVNHHCRGATLHYVFSCITVSVLQTWRCVCLFLCVRACVSIPKGCIVRL